MRKIGAVCGLTVVLALAGCDTGGLERVDAPGDAVEVSTDTQELGELLADAVAEADLAGEATDAVEASADVDAVEVAVPPLFLEGCPVAGRALARRIADPGVHMDGTDAIGRAGDFLLATGKAAFIVEDAGRHNAYYLYGGILVDAVALDGCAQAGPERFQELGIMMGMLNLADFPQSTLRAFRADHVDVINDGSDGKAAVVRATGTDDLFWLVEDELLSRVFNDGGLKPRSGPLGLDITIDYVLDPGASVVRVDVTYKNRDLAGKSMLAGATALFGGAARQAYYSDNVVSIGGLEIDSSVPWLSASAGDGAWAFAMGATNWGTTNISGMVALIDLSQAVSDPILLAAAGLPDDARTVHYFLAVGPTDANSAIRALQPFNPEPIPGMPYTLRPLEGHVHDAASGDPIVGALVDLEAKNTNGTWRVLDGFRTAADGAFAGEIPDFGAQTPPYRLAVHAAGHPDPTPTDVAPAATGPFALTVDPAGTVRWDIRDGTGAAMPAKILLTQDGAFRDHIFVGPGPGQRLEPPGVYDVSVTRGFEYAPWYGQITVTAGQSTDLPVTLQHDVDTTGWMSVDTHCHAYLSPDNTISVPDRIATVAAEGLDIVVSTDHEAIDDWTWGIVADGLQAFVGTIVGQEVTATLPEHCTMAGVKPEPDVDARGGIPQWYGLDLDQLFQAMRHRGAAVVGINHPQGYLADIRYNGVTGLADLDDPTRLDWAPGARLWSWNFDIFELMNGTRRIFRNPGETGNILFDDWMSFFNLGHRIWAVGSSDAHDYEIPGTPRTYFASSTDEPGAFVMDDFVTAMHQGHMVASAGAFARVVVDGHAGPGDTVTDTDGTVDVSVHIEAIPQIDVAWFKVFVNCDLAATVAATAPDAVVKYDGGVPVTITKDSHIVVVGFGAGPMPDGFAAIAATGAPRFVANPVFVDFDGNGKFDAPGGKTCTYDLDPPVSP